MKYYSFVEENKSKVIGKLDGVLQVSLTSLHKQSDEVEALSIKNLYQEYTYSNKISELHINKKAKITDVMLVGGSLELKGFLISSNFYQIIKEFKGINLQFVDVSFKNRQDVLGYKFMFFYSDLTPHINYDLTDMTVYEYDLFTQKLNPLHDIKLEPNRSFMIEYDKIMSRKSGLRHLFPKKKYHFKDLDIEEYDMFRIGHWDYRFYFSERVKTALEKAGLTGFKFSKQCTWL